MPDLRADELQAIIRDYLNDKEKDLREYKLSTGQLVSIIKLPGFRENKFVITITEKVL